MLVRTLIICLSLVGFIWAEANLISVVQVFRHGERVPIGSYPNDPYSSQSHWPVPPGQLTNKGKLQHYRLGQYTRNRYNDTLPAAYTSDVIYAQTTDVDRTHMSAQCNLLGLFPPTAAELWNPDIAWSPIPVHPSDPSVFNPRTPSPCAAVNEERKRVAADEPYYKKIDEQYRDTYEYLSEHSGSTVTTLDDMRGIIDSLSIQNEFGYTLPSWTEKVFPEPLSRMEGLRLQRYVYNIKLARLSSGPFFNEVINHFETMTKNCSSAQFFRMYSAHDYNIAAILSAFSAFEPHQPYFASSIYLELWKDVSGTYHVNIYYRNKDVLNEVTPPGCLEFNCGLDDFKNLLSDILIDSDTWEKECAA